MNEWNVLGTIGMIRYLLESRRTVVKSFSRALGLGLDLGLKNCPNCPRRSNQTVLHHHSFVRFQNAPGLFATVHGRTPPLISGHVYILPPKAGDR